MPGKMHYVRAHKKRAQVKPCKCAHFQDAVKRGTESGRAANDAVVLLPSDQETVARMAGRPRGEMLEDGSVSGAACKGRGKALVCVNPHHL